MITEKGKTMKISFRVNYKTHWQQRIYIIGSIPALGNYDIEKAYPMTYTEYGDWVADLELEDKELVLEYRYILKDRDRNLIHELGESRKVKLGEKSVVDLHDVWRLEDKQSVFCSSAFKEVLMKHEIVERKPLKGSKHTLEFRIKVPRVPSNSVLAILGNQEGLGNWQEENALLMSLSKCSLWSVQIDLSQLTFPLEYKYAIYNLETKKISLWEYGENRYLPPIDLEEDKLSIRTDEFFRFEIPNWKGAGVAIPVFSLRSKTGFGVGEFLDLKKMIDWVHLTQQKLIQTLPINDTSLTGTQDDSYPYNAISVYASHPMYVNIEAIAKRENLVLSKDYYIDLETLNKISYVEYVEVNRLKWKYLKELYAQVVDKLTKNKDFNIFVEENKHWLKPYAVFCYLKELNKTVNFREWKQYNIFKPEEIDDLYEIKNKEVLIHCFVQYHLHLQLLEVKKYALEKEVILKGDIPIGISPLSVEAWMEPHLFNINASAGAPPDDFSLIGQNWGFPTYNWEKMEKDNFQWWKNRFAHLSNYFDAYRIDHILGFFRIWEIPLHAKWGLLGYFNPALPLSVEEIEAYGISFDKDRFLKSYITEEFLKELFKNDADFVKKTFLNKKDENTYSFKEEFNTQKKAEKYFKRQEKTLRMYEISEGVYRLHTEVLFIEDPKSKYKYHPRISIFQTNTFQVLDEETKSNLDRLYVEYYYNRHNEFWKEQAFKKLPTLIKSTEMMVCGEDLGMIPDSVPEVMKDLEILSLEIERMPKNPRVTFTDLENIPYMSVCSSSTHDMSTIRGWWEEDRTLTQKYYNEVLKKYGEAPLKCEVDICRSIVERHLSSPALWTILPLQDWFSIDEKIRIKDAYVERINIPSNPKHFWSYRMHIDLENLIKEKEFNESIAEIIKKTNRNIIL